MQEKDIFFLANVNFQSLIDVLRSEGYQCIGPQLKNGAIVFDDLESVDQLPKGIIDQQQPGVYRAQLTNSSRYFYWANGPQAIKPYVFSTKEPLWRSTIQANDNLANKDKETNDQENRGLSFVDFVPASNKRAILGVRACDIAALYIQDKHFLNAAIKDPYYAARRQQLFLIAVNCARSAETCFCSSTGDGPQVTYGYDIVLSELDEGFLVHGHSNAGLNVIDQLVLLPASDSQIKKARQEITNARESQNRSVPSEDLSKTLYSQLDHKQWEDIARRCLACGNCTSVCPTCFCHSEDDEPDLDGGGSTYFREWDSCFSQGHSYIHGITIRATTKDRYRQWLTHKFGSWHEQYGRSGCVGCGRCITWCPVGIDVTEEIAKICGDSDNA